MSLLEVNHIAPQSKKGDAQAWTPKYGFSTLYC